MIKKTLFILLLMTGLAAAGLHGDSRRGVIPENISERLAAEFGGVISVYDDIFRAVGAEQGHDWRLISAIAYHESRFNPDIISPRGAIGLMQIMPVVCRHFDIEEEKILDPMANVRLAGMLLAEIENTLRLPESLPEEERMGLLLASYNCGIGHVGDARRLAKAAGENHNSWQVVAHYLELKSQPEYYHRPEVRSGQFASGRQTMAYVSAVMSKYRQYCSLAPDEPVFAEVAANI